MPAPKSATKTTTSSRQPTRTKNGNARVVLPLTWSATEYVPKKRWSWYVTFGYITATITLLLLAAGNWSAAMVTFAIGATIFVMYLAKPRLWSYSLESRHLVITSGKRNLRLPLTEYRAFTTEEIRGSDRKSYVLIVLLPRGRFTVSRDVYLTGDDTKNLQIAEALNGLVAFDEEPPYHFSTKTIDRLARWLRLN